MEKNIFYNTYHKKNDFYVGQLKRPNFTYYYSLQILHNLYEKHVKNPVVLDIGCGVGTISLYVSQFSKWVVGIDISERAIEIARQARSTMKIKNTLFINKEMKNFKEKFDLIICSEIIEHIENDDRFLKMIAKSLKKGGFLYLSTPLSTNIFVNTPLYKKFDKEVGHVRRYNPLSIQKKLHNHSFEIVDCHVVESPLRNILFLTKLGFLIRFIKGPLIPLFHFFDELLLPFLGASNIILVARKS